MSTQIEADQTETINCPLCRSTRFEKLQSGPDYFMRLPGIFHLVRCKTCGLLDAKRAAAIHRILLHPVARALAWLPFSLADWMAGGSNVEALVR